jgi:hypothetical protein
MPSIRRGIHGLLLVRRIKAGHSAHSESLSSADKESFTKQNLFTMIIQNHLARS